jgi:hypothetical protein
MPYSSASRKVMPPSPKLAVGIESPTPGVSDVIKTARGLTLFGLS